MKVIIGSKNQDKIKIVKKALRELHLDAQIEGVEVESGITNQPLDKETTKKGAVNRAKDAKKKMPKASLWIGLEGGLHNYNGGYQLVTYACLIDKSGREFMGEGEKIKLPQKVSERIKRGEWFGKLIREYAKKNSIDQNLITRITPFTQAIQEAYGKYLKVFGNLKYRKKVSAIILDSKGNFLIDQLVNYEKNQWNWPGGGIDKGESARKAILRELKEELGTDKFKVIKKAKFTNKYDWPPFVIVKILKAEGKTWKGQKVTYFLLKFTGDKKDINPNPKEIRKVRWVSREKLANYFIFPQQKYWKNFKFERVGPCQLMENLFKESKKLKFLRV